MGKQTGILWADSTASPWTGCTPVSDGCRNCYAQGEARRRGWSADWGAGVPRHRLVGFKRAVLAMEHQAADGRFRECGHCGKREWDKPGFNPMDMARCECGHWMTTGRPRVFPSLCDWLDQEVPVEWLAGLLDVIRRTPHLDWLLLSKRPVLWRSRLAFAYDMLTCGSVNNYKTWAWIADWTSTRNIPENVWIGATCENQAAADERIPELLRIPAARRFVSVEPMLGQVDLRYAGAIWSDMNNRPVNGRGLDQRIDAVFCGGESGPHARPMHPDWARSLRDQCAEAGVPFTFKQWGEWAPLQTIDGRQVTPFGDYDVTTRFGFTKVGTKRAGRMLDGREWNGKDGGR